MLKRGILNLDLAPGAMLDEVRIARQLGVSKTPVREAIARLEGEGLVASDPGRRSRVAEISPRVVREIFEVRKMLEAASLRQLAPQMTDADLESLRQSLEHASESLDQEEIHGFVESNDEFHSFLVRRSGNQCLIGIVSSLLDQARRVSAAIFRSEQQAANHTLSQQGMQSHFAILDALYARDGDLAAELMERDIQLFLDAIDTPELQHRLDQLTQRE